MKVMLAALAALTLAPAALASAPTTRAAITSCLEKQHLTVRQGTDTTLAGQPPDVTFRYHGHGIQVDVLPSAVVAAADRKIGLELLQALSGESAADSVTAFGNVIFFRANGANLTSDDGKLIGACVRP